MPEKLIRNFIYTDVETGTVLRTKSSLEYDFFLQISGIKTIEIRGLFTLENGLSFAHRYDWRAGLSARVPPEAEELKRLLVQKRKVEVLLLMLSNLHMVRTDIAREKGLTGEQLPLLSPESLIRYRQVKERGRELLLSKVQLFWEGFVKGIEASENEEQISSAYQYIVDNCAIGAFSVVNREREYHA